LAILVIMLKIKVKIEIRDRKNKEIIDMEDEDWAASEQEHRDYAALGMAALSVGVLGTGLINLILVAYIDTLVLIPPDSMTHFDKFKILLPLGCVLVSSVMWMFHEVRTETRELALLAAAILLSLFTIQHIIALRLVINTLLLINKTEKASSHKPRIFPKICLLLFTFVNRCQ
jgi:hypothetical protein